MYCSNCGNKVDEKAYICVNCGVILKNDEKMVIQKKKSGNGLGISSMVIGILSLLFCLSSFLIDISEVGMYTKFIDRFFYAVGFNLFQTILTVISFCLGISGGKNKFSKVGVILSFLSFFLIVTEFVVIFIY